MLKISWGEKGTIVEVLGRATEKRTFLKQIKRRRALLIGHILQNDRSAKKVIEGQVEEKCCRGTPRLEYIKQINEDMNCGSYCQLKVTAEKR